MSNDIIPFGKYKGKPIEALREDVEYCDWLVAQNWFRDRYAGLFTIIVNNFGEPSITPEHNAMQALFLKPSYAWCFAEFATKQERDLQNIIFEDHGADVVLIFYQIKEGCFDDLRIEIKPSVGDDYPAILRQMKNNKSNVLFIRTYTGSGASKDEFVSIFKMSRISVIFEADFDDSLKEEEEEEE